MALEGSRTARGTKKKRLLHHNHVWPALFSTALDVMLVARVATLKVAHHVRQTVNPETDWYTCFVHCNIFS